MIYCPQVRVSCVSEMWIMLVRGDSSSVHGTPGPVLNLPRTGGKNTLSLVRE